MSKKNFDYKATLNFEVSSHNQPEYQTDEMIKKSVLQLLKQHLEETKSKQRNDVTVNSTLAVL